ncbi:MAG: succinate dehydrogenase assembly factor 2 [Methylococcales bacterium]|nr:succinate dehydrogenase assembly factor 2 [Methylococcales bacterium]
MDQHFKHLQWQCRRGTQELDKLLLTYLNTVYPAATPQEQQLFEQFLSLEDNLLLAFLLSEKYPKESKFAKLIVNIRLPKNIPH